MPNSPTMDDARPRQSWAEVRAHDQVMRYRRVGAGRPLLVLESCSGKPLCPELRDALAGSYRLITPLLPAEDVHLAGWLADFLEGMGCSGVGVVATEPLCIPAMELALLGIDQISRLVIVADEPPTTGRYAGTDKRGALESAARVASVPLLLVRCNQSSDEAVSLLMEFLGEE